MLQTGLSIPLGPDTTDFELSPIKAMEIAASKIPGVISLAQGIPSFQTPESIKEFVRERLAEGVCDKYSLTIGLAELREEISHALQRDEGLTFDPDREILVTAGSIEGISAALLSATEPGDEVLIPSPSYVSYRGAIAVARCVPRYFELDEDNNFDFHIERLSRAISRRTRAILFCSPNNPTGTIFSAEKTRAVIELAIRHNLTVVVDEVYKDFYYTDDTHFTACAIPEGRPRVIRVCSFSKAFAMTGWRVGFLHADAPLVARAVKYHDAMVTCAPVISQYAAIAALRFGLPAFQEFKREFHRRRDFVISRLDELSSVLDYQLPKATYFVFPRVKDSVALARDSRRLAYDILERAKLALVPGIAFGPSGESHLRISFGREMNVLDEGLQRLAEYLHGPSRKRVTTPRPSAPLQAPRSWRRRVLGVALGTAARIALRRHRPTIIGIVGAQGKTAYKRAILSVLARFFRVRGSILSYNTEIGMPLSILGLPAPRPTSELLTFPLSLLRKAWTATTRDDILVLEYGVLNPHDARVLASIAVPDLLVVTGITTSDPNIDARSLAQGIGELAIRMKSPRIIAPPEAELPQPSLLPPLREGAVANHQLATPRSIYALEHEPVGMSARAGLAAAVILAEELGVSFEEIKRVISPNLT